MLRKLASLVTLIFLVSLVFFAATAGRARASSTGDVGAGLEVHKKFCVRCHGETGKGDGKAGALLKTKPADWTNKEKFSKLSDDYLFKVIRQGGGAVDKSKLMPAFSEEKLSDDDIRNVIAFVRSLGK